MGVLVCLFLLNALGGRDPPAETPKHLYYNPSNFPIRDVCRVDPLSVELATLHQSSQEAAAAVEAECMDVTEEQLSRCKVPPVLHLVLGYPGKFDFYSYVSVKSAHDRMKPDSIFMHVFGQRFDPPPYLQRAIKEFGIILVSARDVREVQGRPVDVVEHRSDVVRLESLIRFGGIYMDLDAFVLQPLDVFYDNELTMGAEDVAGVNNGFIIAKRCSRFLRNWYAEYKSFDDSKWGEHSILLPKKLAAINPELIRVEQDTIQSDFTDTFERLWSEKFEEAYWRPVRAVHSFIRLAETRYDEESIKNVTNNFGTMVGRIMAGKPGMMD